jgi:hypothetical protein
MGYGLLLVGQKAMSHQRRAVLILCLSLTLLAVSLAAEAGSRVAHQVAHGAKPPIKHVFVIVLENKGFDETFGAESQAPYLGKTLPSRGVLLTQYFGTTHYSLGNYIAMISGQAGNPQTQGDCERYTEFALKGVTADGQAIGSGCLYPATIKTLADQLQARGLQWKAYMEDMGNDPAREALVCAHPMPNTMDLTQSASAPSERVPRGDQYATRHNPFVYFHSIIDSPACATHVVNLSALQNDLATVQSTPNFVFITPNLCHDGHDAPCKNGEPGGLVSADTYLKELVPQILQSPAYQQDGLLVVTFDEGEVSETPNGQGGFIDRAIGASCCEQQPGPNFGPFPQTIRDGEYLEIFDSFGGDRTGAVLLSPFLDAGRVSTTPFNHYSLLKSLEDVFGIDQHLGYAAQAGLVGFFDADRSDVLWAQVKPPATY